MTLSTHDLPTHITLFTLLIVPLLSALLAVTILMYCTLFNFPNVKFRLGSATQEKHPSPLQVFVQLGKVKCA